MLTIEEQQALTAGLAQQVRSGKTMHQAFTFAFNELGIRMMLERESCGKSDSPELLHLRDCYQFLEQYALQVMSREEEN